jgi:hypothetical protein
MTHALYWHLATHAPDADIDFFPPPYMHKLIALGAIEEDGDNLQVWANVSMDPTKLLDRLEGAVGEAHAVYTFRGNQFGLPVVRSNAIRSNYQAATAIGKIESKLIPHYDVSEIINQGLYPSGGCVGMGEMTDIFGLPNRPKLDVRSTWDKVLAVKGTDDWKAQGPKLFKRLGSKCIVDAVLTALLMARYEFSCGDRTKEETEVFEERVIQTAADKTKMVTKLFGVQEE